MLLCLKGSPFLYYGEEIGMNCHRLAKKDLRDPLGINTWPLGFLGRDPSRRPMQWNADFDAGFGFAESWLPLDPEWRACNVAAQRGDPASLLEWYRALLALRRTQAALRRGSLHFIKGPKGLFAWERILIPESMAGGENRDSSSAIRAYLNFRSKPLKFVLDAPLKVLLSNKRKTGISLHKGSFILEASEALIGEVSSL